MQYHCEKIKADLEKLKLITRSLEDESNVKKKKTSHSLVLKNS